MKIKNKISPTPQLSFQKYYISQKNTFQINITKSIQNVRLRVLKIYFHHTHANVNLNYKLRTSYNYPTVCTQFL